ncbi:hypothetical protein GB937_010225 [Aspergillus fischeri]|nr:hypothetical protein GB937_010225 [Aspergillus fischeri]
MPINILQKQDEYPCYPSTYFTLNPGTQMNKFFNSINHSCITITHPSTASQSTITATIMVNPTRGVITTLTS